MASIPEEPTPPTIDPGASRLVQLVMYVEEDTTLAVLLGLHADGSISQIVVGRDTPDPRLQGQTVRVLPLWPTPAATPLPKR